MSDGRTLDPVTGGVETKFGYVKIEEIHSDFLKYVAVAKVPPEAGATTLDTLKASPIWKIYRQVTITGEDGDTEIITEWANDKETFDFIFDVHETYFRPIPFQNYYSVLFDGTTQYMDVSHDASIDFDRLDPWSYSFWAKSTDAGAFTYLDKHVSNRGTRIYKLAASDKIEIRFRGAGTGDRIRVQSTSSIPETYDGAWHHYAVTYDGSGAASGVTLYMDSVSQPLSILNDTLTGSTLNAGNLTLAANVGGGNYYGGYLDEVAIWSSELSQSNVTSLYNAGKPDNIAANGPQVGNVASWWRMGNGDTPPTVSDHVGSNDGTLINGPTIEVDTP